MDAIGFIGLGKMGAAMARNLVAAGFRVRAWNRTPGKTPQGAIECASPREVAGQSALVITMVADDAAAEQVTLGENGVIAGLPILGLLEAIGEATALAEKGGLDPRELMAIFGKNSFGSPIFNGYAPRIAATEFEPAGFSMPLGLKDVMLALQAGAELRVPLPLASLTRDHLLAAIARGRESWDWGGLASVVREAAGLPPRRS